MADRFVTNTYKRDPNARALINRDRESLMRYKTARQKNRQKDEQIIRLQEQINTLTEKFTELDELIRTLKTERKHGD